MSKWFKMKTLLLLLVFVTFFLAGFYTCYTRGAFYQSLRFISDELKTFFGKDLIIESEKPSILIVGDSLAARGDWRILQQKYTTINCGKGGALTSEVFKNIGFNFKKEQQFKAVVVLTGTNDIGHQSALPEVMEHYQDLIMDLDSYTEQIILVSVPLLFGPDEFDRRPSIRMFNQMLESVEGKGVSFIEWSKVLSPYADTVEPEWIADKLHLKGKAYSPLGEEILQILKKQ